MSSARPAAELGLTLVELVVTLTILAILATIPISSYLHMRDDANSKTAGANVRVIVPSIEAYFADNGTYATMSLANLKSGYDKAILPSRYQLTGVGPAAYCVSSASGGMSWKKAGPGADYVTGTCP